MNLEIWHTIEGIAGFAFGAVFLGFVMRYVYLFGGMVKEQGIFLEKITAASATFEKYAERMDRVIEAHASLLNQHQVDIRGIQVELKFGRRASDQGLGDSPAR